MRTLNIKGMMSALAAIVISVTGNSGTAFAGKLVKPDRFEKENQDIRQDLARIGIYREHVKFLKAKMKDDRSTGKKTAVILDKKELRKTKADIRKEKCYLKADKKDLKADRKLAIREKCNAVHNDKKKMADAKRKKDDRLAATYKNDLERDRAALKQERSDYSTNMVAVNKAIRKSNGEFFIFNYAEGGMAGIGNRIRNK